MKKLFLSSYFSEAASLFPAFADDTCAGKKVVFIPTASIPEKVTFYVDADKKALGKLGMSIDELDVADASYSEISSKLSDTDYIFVEGGNTFFLLQELRKSSADKLIVEHINQGKPYIGASAGSMIVSKNIEYVKYMDKMDAAPDLQGDFTALSVIDFYIVPHCTNFPFKKSADKIMKDYADKMDLYAINNNQVVIVEGDRIKTVTAESKKKK